MGGKFSPKRLLKVFAEALFAAAATPYGDTVLSVVNPVKKLVESAQEK